MDSGEGPDLEKLEQDLHQAIAELLGQRGVMVTKWLLAVEMLADDGDRVMEGFASPDLRAWDSLGMISYLDARERGAVGAEAARDHLAGEDDG